MALTAEHKGPNICQRDFDGILFIVLKATCFYYEAFCDVNKDSISFIKWLGDYIGALRVLTFQVQLNQLPNKASTLRVLFLDWLID